MILEDEGKSICRYIENETLPNNEGVGIGSKEYMANTWEIYVWVLHDNLPTDLVEHIFNTRTNHVVDDFIEDDLFNYINDESEMFEGDSDEDFDDVSSNDY